MSFPAIIGLGNFLTRIDAGACIPHNRGMHGTAQLARTEPPWRAGLRGARANLVPGLCIWAFTLLLVGSYLLFSGVREALAAYTELRRTHGLISASISTALFAALIPAVVHFVRRRSPEPGVGRRLLWLTCFWAYKGIEFELWLRFMAWFVGDDASLRTVLIKTLLDQFVFCTLWAIPNTWAAYALPENGFSVRTVWARVRARGWYLREVLPILIANFGVWAPALCLIFLLPTPLQLTVQNLVLCFFTLLLAHVAREQATGHRGDSAT